MSQCFALTFDQPNVAERAFRRAQRCVAERVLWLDDACIAVRPGPDARVVLARPRLPHAASALSPRFLGQLLGQLGVRPDAPKTGGLDPLTVERFTARMAARSSALILCVRKLDVPALRPQLGPFLEEYRGRVARLSSSFDPRGNELDDVPSAQELAMAALHEIETRSQARLAKSHQAAHAWQARLAKFEDPSRADDALRSIVQRCRAAAGRGQTWSLVYQFPSAILTDRGRAVHAGDPGWPRTLRGEPLAVHTGIERQLVPKGYRLEAAVLDYPDGLLGDVGLYLRWAHEAGV
ncbi:MAG: hypothetical protein EA356_17660 [Geminicoccaceae bacterium]|nr:MAG: hypothetical protein EA356_17660 [Geminicoccaceae bacterium]